MKTTWFFSPDGLRFKAEVPDEVEALPSLMIGNKCACGGVVVALDYTTKLAKCSNGEQRLFPVWYKQVDDQYTLPQLHVYQNGRIAGHFYFEMTK
jgi:hypothetical protein